MKKTKARKKTRSKDPNTKFQDAAVDLLKSGGWNVVVIGGARVQREFFQGKFKFELVIPFVGGNPRLEVF